MKKRMKQCLSAGLAAMMLLTLMPSAVVFANSSLEIQSVNFNGSTTLPDEASDSSGTNTLSIDNTTFVSDVFQKNFLKLEGTSSGYAQLMIAFDEIKSEGANKYAELSFDMYTSNVKGVGSNATLRINNKAKTLFLANGGDIYIGENTSGTKLAETEKFDSGNWVNYKLVFQLTDGDQNPVNKIVAVYQNGVSVMKNVECVFNDNYTSLQNITIQLSKKNGEYWLGLDNFIVASYSSADGTSPLADKAALKTAIQSVMTTLAAKEHLLETEEVIEYENKINNLMTVYENASADKATIQTATGTAAAIQEEIESVTEETLKPEVADDTFQIVFSKNFNASTTVPAGITNTGDTLSINGSQFAGQSYLGNYLNLTGSSSAYAALTMAFDAIKPEGANKYAEIAFDMFAEGQKTAGSHLTIRLSNKVKSLYYANGGGLFIGENANGSKLATTSALDSENWKNYRIIMHLTDASGNKVNKIVGIYENGVNITEEVECPFDESYATLSQITMQLSKKAGSYALGLDNVCVASYVSADGTSPMANRSYLRIEGEKVLQTLKSSFPADTMTEEMKNKVLETAAVYTSETATAKEIATAKEELATISNRIQAILALKESGEDVYVVEPTLSASELKGLSEVTAQMQLVTSDKSYTGNAVVVLLGESENFPQGEVLDVVAEPVSLKANDTTVATLKLDLTPFTNLQKQTMRIVAFVLTDMKELSFANENSYWLLGNEIPRKTEDYTFGADVNAGLKIIDNENQKIVITVNGGKQAAGKVVSAIVLKKGLTFDTIANDVNADAEYMYRTIADENGCAVFELAPLSGPGVYAYQVASDAFGKKHSGSVTYSSAGMINDAFSKIYRDSGIANIKAQADILTIDKVLLERAEASKIPVADVVKEVLAKKMYDALSLDEFSEKVNGTLSLLSGVINAKSVDILQNLIETYYGFLDNGSTLLAYKPGAVYSDSMSYIYAHRAEALSIKAVDDLITAAIAEASQPDLGPGTGGAVVGGGGGGGATVGYPKVGESEVHDEEEPKETPAEKAAGRFNDLADVEWAVPAISLLTTAGCINGKSEGVFAPHDDITREEFVKMAVLAFGFEDSTAVADFSDVETGSWYAPYVAAAAKAGIVTGESETRFGVGRNITRQEMAAILHRILTLKQQGITEDGVYIEFNDEFKFEDYAKDAIIELAKSGIVNGVGGNEFMPDKNSTRAEAAKMLYEAYVRVH